MTFGPDQGFTIFLALVAVLAWLLLKNADRKARRDSRG